MKRLIVLGLIASVIGIGGNMADAQNALPAVQPSRTVPMRPSSVIDDIAVPLEVLNNIQLEFQGYAVTEARKLVRNGQEAYRLRIDRDDDRTDYESFYLTYDKDWFRIGDKEKAAAPRPKPPEPEPERQREPEKPQPAERPEGGRGGGGGGDDEQEEDDEVEEEPPEDTDEEPAPEEEPGNDDEDPEGAD